MPPSLASPQQRFSQTTVSSVPEQALYRQEIRRSLEALTWDGVLSYIFDVATKGVLLSNFLVDLGAGPVAVGCLASIPLLANLLQPWGAHLSEQQTSCHRYCYLIIVDALL